MTPRERAGAVWDMFALDLAMPGDNRPPVTVDRIILAIQQAIIAAEEEKTNIERKACEKIIQDEIEVWKNFTNNELPIRDLTNVLNQIRARSES